MNPYQEGDRQPPSNLDLEQAILGAVLIWPQVLDRIADTIDSGHFFDPLHGEIYEASADMYGKGQRPTPITVAPLFADRMIDDERSVAQYLGQLAARHHRHERFELRRDAARIIAQAAADRHRRRSRQ
jgi:replicative DNA helicase